MKKGGNFVIFCVLVLCCSFCGNAAEQCTTDGVLRTCDLGRNVTALKIFQSQVLVGSVNALSSYGPDLSLLSEIELLSKKEDVDRCRGDFLDNCENSVKVIEPVPDSDKILVCGTYAAAPTCTLHLKGRLENYTKSPYNNEDYISLNDGELSIITSNQRFFGATSFRQMGMSNDTLDENRAFRVRVTARRDNVIAASASFIGVHDYGDHVYFFIAETASVFEVAPSISESDLPTYSKVIRICKSDDGINDVEFSTIQKVRIQCNNGKSGGTTYVYNEIVSTYMTWENEEAVLYAAFKSPKNGPAGSAICKYAFSPNITGSLTNVFEDGKYYVENTTTKEWMIRNGPKVDCSSSSTRSTEDARRYIISANTVTGVPNEGTDRPLAKIDGENLRNIAVETIALQPGVLADNATATVLEILYYSNQLGEIKQGVANVPYTHNLLAAELDRNGDFKTVQDLLVQKEASGTKSSLYISRGTKLIRIRRGYCKEYTSCGSCLGSGDPYCGWHSETLSCLNHFEKPKPEVMLIPAVSSDAASTCGGGTINKVTTQNPADPSSLMVNSDRTGSFSVPSQESQTNGNSSINIPVVAGAAIGTFIVGLLLGLFVCLFFTKFRRYSKKRTYQVHDKSKSNNIYNDNTVSDAPPVTLKEVKIAENSDCYKSNNTNLPRYVDHALPQHGKAQSTDPEVKINVIEVGPNTPKQNGIAVDALPVKIGNDEVIDNKCPSSQSSITTDTESCVKSVPIKTEVSALPPISLAGSAKANFTPSPQADPKSPVVANHNYSRAYPPAPMTPGRYRVGSSSTLPYNMNRHANKKETSMFNFSPPNHDDAFAENDTVPPLVSQNTYGSLGRNKSYQHRRQVPNHRVPKGRTDSTTWLRQDSVSSEVSPLQSPISDV